MANADLISALHPFRGSCKPEWLFIIAGLFTKGIFCSSVGLVPGEVVAVMHGSSAVEMKAMVKEEIYREQRVHSGSRRRSSISVMEAVPGKKYPFYNTNI